MLGFLRFLFRNGGISALGIRNTAVYKRVMKEYLSSHPNCEYCGRDKKLDVHHKIPVSVAPELATDKNNMVTLCRKPQCHFIIGHKGNWKDYNDKISQILSAPNAQI